MTRTVQGSKRWWRGCVVLWALGLLLTASLVVAAPGAKLATSSTTVSITFDDALAEQNAAADILHGRGLNGTFYIISSAVGTPGHFKQGDLKRLVSLGHEIGGHSVSHRDLTTLPADEARREVCTDRATLARWGFRVTSFSYPYASHNRSIEAIVRDCGYNSARLGGGILRPGTDPRRCPHCPMVETIPPANPYTVRTLQAIDPSWTLEEIKGVVTNAEDHGGGWVILIFHHISDDHGPLSTSPAVLDAIAAWLSPRKIHGTQVKTIDQVIRGSVKPIVDAVPDAAHGVMNPSAEIASGARSPACRARTKRINSARWKQTGAAPTRKENTTRHRHQLHQRQS
jgi:peptidoglycan/xylan/chitin deacetylase (PgdA/CDA1 family)